MVFAHGTINRLYHNIQLTAKEQYTYGRNDGFWEFAEKLKNKLDIVGVHPTTEDEFIFMIDELVKEMTEGIIGNHVET